MAGKDTEIVSSAINKEKENLDALSINLWNKPELALKETYAHSVLTRALENYGFSVKKHYILETAFRAEFSRGTNGPVVAVLCEYDALPEIGHACGHNLIAESGIAAAIGIKAVMDSDPTISGKVVVLGSPGEEGRAGKVRLLENGAFEDVDIALMVHPCNNDTAAPTTLCYVRAEVTFKGREAHASAYPWEGKNALDAAVAAYVNVGLLRQHIKPMCRVHGIITNGGAAPNVIPGETKLVFFVRAPTSSELNALKVRVKSCFESAALATGCEMECKFIDSESYLNVISNQVLVSLYKAHSRHMGTKFLDDIPISPSDPPRRLGSTDMGNVSYVVPSIQPFYNIGEHTNHTKAFAQLASTSFAHDATRKAAIAIALTAISLMRSPELVKEAKESFRGDIACHK